MAGRDLTGLKQTDKTVGTVLITGLRSLHTSRFLFQPPILVFKERLIRLSLIVMEMRISRFECRHTAHGFRIFLVGELFAVFGDLTFKGP